MGRKGHCALAAALIITTSVGPAGAESLAACYAPVGKKVAAELAKAVNTLADFTSITCAPAQDTGGCTLLCLTPLRLSANQRRVLLVVLLSGGGYFMSEAGAHYFTNLYFMDKELAEAGLVAGISADRAIELHRLLKAKILTTERLSASIEAEFATKPLPKRK